MFDPENPNTIPEEPSKDEPVSSTYEPVSSFTYQNTEGGYQSGYSAPQPSPVPAVPVTPSPQPPKPDKPRARFSALTLVCCLVAAVLLSTMVSVLVTTAVLGNNSGTVSGQTSSQYTGGNANITITDGSSNYVEAVAAKVSPSVVGVVARYTYTTNNFFGQNSNDVKSEGSGVIYSSDGYIITNKHVVDYAISYSGTVEIYLPEQPDEAIPATVVGYDAAYDLAVLKIDRTGLPAVTTGSSADLVIGQHVVAIGNPGGLEFMGSVSVGYLSGISRNITVDTFQMKVLQTDAAINPGNSGGALVDSEGNLIGITNSKIVSEDFEGMGFAIPVDTVVEVCNDLITNSNQPKPYIGVQIDTSYTTDFLKANGYPSGIVVSRVVEGSPADTAGIKRYDIITKADGVDIDSYSKLVNVIHKHSVGETISITVYRAGKTYDLSVVTVASNG